MDPLRRPRIPFTARLPDGSRLDVLGDDALAGVPRLLAESGSPLEAVAPEHVVLGILAADSLVGALVTEPLPDRNALLLLTLAVRAAERRRGLGAALMHASLDVARACDVDVVGAHCAIDDHAAQAWLERCGFRLFSIFPQPRRSSTGVHIDLLSRYARLVSPPGSIAWPRPADLTPRVAAMLARVWGDPPSSGIE